MILHVGWFRKIKAPYGVLERVLLQHHVAIYPSQNFSHTWPVGLGEGALVVAARRLARRRAGLREDDVGAVRMNPVLVPRPGTHWRREQKRPLELCEMCFEI